MSSGPRRGRGGGSGRSGGRTTAAGSLSSPTHNPGAGGRGGGGGGGGGNSNSNNHASNSSSSAGRSSRNNDKNNNSNNRRPNNRQRPRAPSQEEGGGRGSSAGHNNNGMRDEDVLIAFMPYLRASDSDAAQIYEQYQEGNDQRAFLMAAREFLEQQQQQQQQRQSANKQQQQPPFPANAGSNGRGLSADTASLPAHATSAKNLRISHGEKTPPTLSQQQTFTNLSAPPASANRSASIFASTESSSSPAIPSNPFASNDSNSTTSYSVPPAPQSNPIPGAIMSPPRTLAPTSHLLPQPLNTPSAPFLLQHEHQQQQQLLQQHQQQIQDLSTGSSHSGGGMNMSMHAIEKSLDMLWHDSSNQHLQNSGNNSDVATGSSNNPHTSASPSGSGVARLPAGLSAIWGEPVGDNSGAMLTHQNNHHLHMQSGSSSTIMTTAHTSTTAIMTPPRPGGSMASNNSNSNTTSPWGSPAHATPNTSTMSTSPAAMHVSPPKRSDQQPPPSTMSLYSAAASAQSPIHAFHYPQQQQQQQRQNTHRLYPPSMPQTPGSASRPSKAPTAQSPAIHQYRHHPHQQQQESKTGVPVNPPATPTEAASTATAAAANAISTAAPPVAGQGHKKELLPPRRLWTHFEEQPGRIVVNGMAGDDSSLVLHFGPREELIAHWSLPLDYLRVKQPKASTIEEALNGLTVGLFRRGCTENGNQASIISKTVMGDDNRAYEFWKDPATNCLRGKVPFYSPRTPGHVVLRMYWENESQYTLAMGPALLVRVLEKDFEGSVRFILSNFKGKKYNPTSLSSLHSLALVLETPLTRPNDSAARACWGCIQEARKVLEACLQEYVKTSSKLTQLEDTVSELKKQVGNDDTKSQELSLDDDGDDFDNDEPGNSTAAALREKTRALMSGRASCERKWRDSQLAFASILRAVVTNPSMSVLLRRDLITKMRLEFELWCPLSEEFALPSESAKMWYENLRETPHAITPEDFRTYSQARVKMQMRTLGFDPNTLSLDDVLFPRNRGTPSQRAMDPGAVNVFNSMSGAMGQFFQTLYANEDVVVRQRELIRERVEKCVQECGAFPPGTRVLIFGSSANGFGSPKSDLDMCLQLPEGSNFRETDETGAQAMARLAEHFERSGMKEVDTARLTARIPIIIFHCPNPLSTAGDSDTLEFFDCDISIHNPLAVLNTALLRSYAEITPVTRLLASIIKRWAKSRDINNPARHTLSSYGYIVMLLHFLTYHKRTGNGLISPIAPPEGNPRLRNRQVQHPTPLLPNLQWMEPMWPNFPKGTPYQEVSSLPQNITKHPFVEGKVVNAYFFKASTPNDKAVLNMLFPGQDLSLGLLLASFFRYYAYEFDYKRYVVSLHSTASRGLVEREVKAELDGWRNYSAALAIEDPFETFYDIAHVLRGGYYHRIRREFAVAYTKLADAASGRPGSWNKSDLHTMSGQDLIDWICEPVAAAAVDKDPLAPAVPTTPTSTATAAAAPSPSR